MLKLPYRRIIGALAAVLMVFSLISLEILDVYAVTPTYAVSPDYKNSKYYAPFEPSSISLFMTALKSKVPVFWREVNVIYIWGMAK